MFMMVFSKLPMSEWNAGLARFLLLLVTCSYWPEKPRPEAWWASRGAGLLRRSERRPSRHQGGRLTRHAAGQHRAPPGGAVPARRCAAVRGRPLRPRLWRLFLLPVPLQQLGCLAAWQKKSYVIDT